jgi:glycosyltransferase involved in cell wall biosynthesis
MADDVIVGWFARRGLELSRERHHPTHDVSTANERDMSLDHPASTEHEDPDVPLVSVVIPTRGRAGLLEQCVASMLTQTISRIEVIVVVDGPDPATIDFLASVDDRRLRYVSHPESRGVSNARNTGIGLATGRWLAFCDDDDLWAPTKLAAQLTVLRENPEARWAIAGAIRVHQDRGTAAYPEPVAADVVTTALPHSNVVPGGCSGVIADRRLVIELGAFDPRLSLIADHDLWIRLNWSSPVVVAAEPLVAYRDHDGAMTRRIRKLEDELDVLREKYRDELAEAGLPFPADIFYVWTYRRTFRVGDWAGGLALLARSPRFRFVLPRCLWSRARDRLRLAVPGTEPFEPRYRMVTVTEFPWLVPILGPAPETDDDGDVGRQQPRGAVDEISSVA